MQLARSVLIIHSRWLYVSSQYDEVSFVIQYRGHTRKTLAPLATQTSNVMKKKVQKHRETGTHCETMHVSFDELCPGLDIPPYVLDEIIVLWYELRIAMSHEKRKIIKKAVSTPKDAPLSNDYTGTMTGLMSLIHPHDASYALDDALLKCLTTAHLRKRLIEMRYNMSAWVEAMNKVCARNRVGEKNILLRKMFLSSAIFSTKSSTGMLPRGRRSCSRCFCIPTSWRSSGWA
ncbi:hypothetical protein PMIN02_005719 [Paraphaeosphaeria minitans]